jgi:serine/threonine-protein kinase
MTGMREQLGPYRVLAPLGSGGMGEVYSARDPSLGRKVAIKLLPVRLSADRETLTRFTREARSASALNHPNIVTIHEVGMDAASGSPYIVMEYIEGRDLRTLLSAGPLPNRQTLDIAAQIADGLAAAHEQGIIHRDLKPENVMVTKDGYVKILDFGLAKMVGPVSEDDVTVHLDLPGTNPGTILGTVGYMSPEQATGKPLDFRSDQFALGAILYELSTGRAAFEAENAIDTLSAILHDNPPAITRFNAQVPEPFRWIVERLLAKDPAERFASTREIARDLRNIRDRFATMTTADEIPRPPRVSKRSLAVAGAIAAVLAVAGGAALVQRYNAAPSAAAVASKKYLAVMRFRDLTGMPNGQLVVDGLAETLSARLAHFPAVQVMRPATPDAAPAANAQQAARDLGANVVLTGSMQRDGDRVRVAYEIVDVAHGTPPAGDLIEGSASELFSIQDRLADSVAATLQLGAPAFRPQPADTTISQTRYLEALGYLRRYDNEAAVDHAIAILEDLASRSSSASVQAALGRAYLAKFQLTHDAKWANPATAACERAIVADAQNPDVHVTLGELRRLQGHLDDAAKEYKAALAQQPNSADAILGLAETYKADGKLADAEAAYKKSIELQPNYWGGYNKLGVFYATNRRLPESAEMFHKVIGFAPDNLRAYNNLGGVYEQMGRYNDALVVFSDSIKRQPSAQAYSNLGTCYYYLGRYSDAATAFEHATRLTPTKYLYWANLGDAQRWVPGHEPRAAAAYDQAISLCRNELVVNPADAFTRARLAECLAKRGKTPAAETEIARALRTGPPDGRIFYKAALVANLTGRDADAVTLLKKAVTTGYDKNELQRDPELALLRNSDTFKRAFAQ